MRLINSLVIAALFSLSTVSLADTDAPVLVKASPEVTFDKVQEIFGHNLDTDDTMLKTLLLAIGMDHTSRNSPNANQDIGIPYIVHQGPGYWVARLKSGERKLEVLVNNALLLLFTKENIPNAKETGLALLKSAADMGYWPADYYVAEHNLTTRLTMDYSNVTPKTGAMDSDSKVVAKDTMERYNRCAEMEFAPCQYRIGFWLSGSPQTLNDGLNILRKAIHTTMNDSRYQGVLDGALVMAAREIVFKGDQVGMDKVVREKYANLVQRQLSLMTNELNEDNKL